MTVEAPLYSYWLWSVVPTETYAVAMGPTSALRNHSLPKTPSEPNAGTVAIDTGVKNVIIKVQLSGT